MKKLFALLSVWVFGLSTIAAHATTLDVSMPGSDRDAHGCIPSAGYVWSEEAKACVRPWENSAELIVGGDSDEHGCKASAGYIWSEQTQACVRPWEQNGADLVTWAYNNGITKFDTVDGFNGDSAITRQQAAKMFMARLQSTNLPIAMPKIYCVFEDETSIDPTLKASVNDVCALGLMKGYKGKFMPNGYIGTDAIKALAARVVSMMPELKNTVDQVVTLLPEGKLVSRMDFIKALQYANGVVVAHIDAQKSLELKAVQANLDAAKALWKKAAKTSYTMTQTRSCFCMDDSIRPMSFDVVNGSVMTGSAAYADASGGKLSTELLSRTSLYTVEAAFDYIQEAINGKAERITVEYDATTGYPKSLYVDRSYMIADEEMGLTFVMTK